MSDNDLVQNNVIQLPPTTAGETKPVAPQAVISTEEVNEKATNSQEFVMRLIEKNRKKGIEQAQRKLETLSEHELLEDPREENTLRDLMGALQGLLTWAEATSSLVDFVKHDLISMITNLQQQGAQSWQSAAHLQTLIALLKDKGQITEDEMKATWEKVVAPAREARNPTVPA